MALTASSYPHTSRLQVQVSKLSVSMKWSAKEYKLDEVQMAYHYPIFNNCIPHCDSFLENDYTKEEMKLVHETRKILGHADLRITATAVRVPVQGGHSEAVNVSFHKGFHDSGGA